MFRASILCTLSDVTRPVLTRILHVVAPSKNRAELLFHMALGLPGIWTIKQKYFLACFSKKKKHDLKSEKYGMFSIMLFWVWGYKCTVVGFSADFLCRMSHRKSTADYSIRNHSYTQLKFPTHKLTCGTDFLRSTICSFESLIVHRFSD